MSLRCTTHFHACDCREERFKELEARLKEAEEVIGFYSGLRSGIDANYGLERPYFYAILPPDDLDDSHPNSSPDYPMQVAGKRARQYLQKWRKE